MSNDSLKYCACPCGRELEGKRTRWFSDACRTKYGRSDDAKLSARATSRSRMLKTRYNITEDDYEKILATQGGGCAICGRAETGRTRHHVDHDHKTLVVRGILCFRCNVHLLGNLTLEQVTCALEYLTNPPAYDIIGQVVSNPASNKRRKKKRSYGKRSR